MEEFYKVIGYKSIKNELENICDIILNSEKYIKLGVTTPRGLLIYGVPGVGKTLMANCFIEASKRKSFVCRKDKSDSEFIYMIKRTFEEAKANAPSIVFLDDMDKFASEDRLRKNAEEFITIQSCIDDCKGKEVFVIATANDLDSFPAPLIRTGRFDKKIKVNCPKGQDAVEIIKYYLSQKSFVDELDIVELAKFLNGRSCSDLETLINEAGIFAGFRNKEKIEMEDMVNAFLRVVFHAPINSGIIDEDLYLQTAYHEAGHTVVTELLQPNSVGLVAIMNYDDDIKGITVYSKNEYNGKGKTLMENRVMGLLAGKASTEIVYGDTDVGAESDLQETFKIVKKLVTSFCSTSFDRFAVDSKESNELLARREMQISVEIEKYYEKVKKMLIQNRCFLDELAKELVQKKALTGNDISKVKEKYFKKTNMC